MNGDMHTHKCMQLTHLKIKKNHTAYYCSLSVVTPIAFDFFFFFTAKPAAGERERENKPHRCAFHLFFPKTVATYFSSRRRGLENANDQNFAVSLLGAIPENLFQSQPDSHSKSRIVLLLNCSSGGGVSVRGRVCPISYEKGNLLADIKSGTVQRGDPYLTNHSNPRIYHDTALNKRSYIVIQHGHSVLKASLSPDKNTERELSSNSCHHC